MLGDGLRIIIIPASLPSVRVAIRAEELGGSTGPDFQDGVNQQLQVNSYPLRVQLLHGKEDVAQAVLDLGAALVASLSERVKAPIPMALVRNGLLDPKLTVCAAHV
jgi:hypothetical protein